MFFRTLFIFSFSFFFLTSIIAQTTEERVFLKMADDLIYQLEQYSFRRAAVVRFSFEGNDHTRIGEYFANELSYAINQSRPRFNLMHRTDVENGMHEYYEKEEAEKRKAPNPLFVNNASGTSELNYDAIGEGLTTLFSSNKMLKGVDVIIRGRIVDDGDEVAVSFSATKKKNTLATGRGRFSKTPKIRDMMQGSGVPQAAYAEQQISDARPPVATSLSRSSSYSSPVVWENANVTIEISGCIQNGRDVECNLSFAAKDKDLTLSMRPASITLFSSANGYEYSPSELIVGDKSSTGNWLKKSVIAHYSVDGKVKFNTITHEMNSIASLFINGYDGVDKMDVQFRNVPVN